MSIVEGIVSGTVKRVMSERGFCFVEVEGQESEVFCHISGFSNRSDFESLVQGDEVNMELEDTEKGIQGNNVVKIRG